ncbi:MAG TPA: glutaredoxin family protein [Sandaracinaceae bacterium]
MKRFAGMAWACGALALCACAGDDPAANVPSEGELVTPPFEVRGEAEGLLLVWFDEEGLHTANRRSEIPEERRAMVRVDDLSLPPDARLDPELVYVADLRRADADGSYPVRRMPRATFDARVSEAAGASAERGARERETSAAAPPSADAVDPEADVVLYGASWCSACRSAAAFLRSRGIEFVERDVEREPGAREAMLRAAQRAGVRPNGIPVIDFRGRIIQGFDRAALERAIRDTTPI